MKRILAMTLILVGALTLAGPLAANEARDAQRAQKREMQKARKEVREATTSELAVSGETLKANIEKLDTELAWQDDIASALKVATKQDKPVFVLNVLGERCGFV
jgi:hypothetical protein